MTTMGRFVVIVPDEYVQNLEISEQHLIIDTKEETTPQLEKKIEKKLAHLLGNITEDGEENVEYYRVKVRGTVIE